MDLEWSGGVGKEGRNPLRLGRGASSGCGVWAWTGKVLEFGYDWSWRGGLGGLEMIESYRWPGRRGALAKGLH